MKNINLGQAAQAVANTGMTAPIVAVLLFAMSVSNAQGFRLLEGTIDGVHSSLASEEITCRELVELYLDRIEAYDKQGPELNAIQHINTRALEEAEELDAAFEASGQRHPRLRPRRSWRSRRASPRTV